METITGRQLIVVTTVDKVAEVEKVLVLDPTTTEKIVSYSFETSLKGHSKDMVSEELFIEALHEKLKECSYEQCPCEIFEL